SVYVPTTPNPTSGFFLMMPRSDVQVLDMTVDAALKYIISMGVVAPAPRVLDASGNVVETEDTGATENNPAGPSNGQACNIEESLYGVTLYAYLPHGRGQQSPFGPDRHHIRLESSPTRPP